MSKAELIDRNKSDKAIAESANEISSAEGLWPVDPSHEEIAVLTGYERFAFRLAHRMNRGWLKSFWTLCQRTLGAGWIHISTYNLMRVYGLENLSLIDSQRPVLIVANHRSFFDMYTVSTVLFRETKWKKQLFFPVRGRFFYSSPLGSLVNLIMGWWSMYPPFFAENDKRLFDRYSLKRLAGLCSEGPGNIIGFHPEGTRNKNPDPYTFLRPQPGVGKLIKESFPQVVPVFIAGLGNELKRQVLGNWRGGEKIRIRFGAPLELSQFREMKDHVRTYKQIADLVMSEIAKIGEEDRLEYSPDTIQHSMPGENTSAVGEGDN